MHYFLVDMNYHVICFRTFIPSMPDELNYFLSGGMGGWLFAMPVSVKNTFTL